MIYQYEWTRIIIVLIPQSFILFIFLYITYKVLKRRRDRSSVILSLFYLTLSIAFSINYITISLLLFKIEIEQILLPLYLLLSFLIIFGCIFLVIFIIDLYIVEPVLTLKRILILILLYGIPCAFLFFMPGNITLNKDNNWTVQYNHFFFISLNIFFSLTITIPIFYYLVKIYIKINFNSLKRKYRDFFIGILGMLIDVYGAFIYNTWHDSLFRSIWSILTFLIIVPSAFLI